MGYQAIEIKNSDESIVYYPKTIAECVLLADGSPLSNKLNMTGIAFSGLNGFSTVQGSRSAYYKTLDNVVHVNCFLSRSTNASGSTIIAKVDSNYAPTTFLRVVGLINDITPVLVTIDSTGNVTVYNPSVEFNSVCFNVTYVTKL